ncbi:MAG: tetratricopeptide repeat protein [Verrucomicrobiota bacterium]
MLRSWLTMLVAIGVWSSGLWSMAHDGPEHEIDELTAQMKVQGESSDLLIQRAIEYNILGRFPDAAKDLERALDLDESSLVAQRELSQTYFSLGKTNEALTTITRALRPSVDTPEQASLHMVRVGILQARREYGKALADANEAIRKFPQNAEWYLVRSQLQGVLKEKHERVTGLERGIEETGSGLLTGELVDALIEDGQHVRAAETVAQELKENRWQASWLIRRAKISLATGRSREAKNDLTAAVEEINKRLGPNAVDPLLLADRGLAYELLGKRDDARRDYRTARQKGLADEWVRERIRALRESPKDEE